MSDMETKNTDNTKRFRGGILLILIAILIIVLSVFGKTKMNIFALVISLVLLAFAYDCARHRMFTGVFFPLAFIYLINYGSFQIRGLTPGVVFIVALLLSIGMSLLVKPEWKRQCRPGHHNHEDLKNHDFSNAEANNASRVYINNYFDGKALRLTSTDFRELEIQSRFSGLMVSMTDVVVPGGKCRIIADIAYSGVELYVPANWCVIDEASHSLGGVNDKGNLADFAPVTLTISGSLRLSGISIIRV